MMLVHRDQLPRGARMKLAAISLLFLAFEFVAFVGSLLLAGLMVNPPRYPDGEFWASVRGMALFYLVTFVIYLLVRFPISMMRSSVTGRVMMRIMK